MEPRGSTHRSVVQSVAAGRVRVSAHALREAELDRLTLADIEVVTLGGECIEDYPDDPRGPSCPILITVYLPDPQRWSDDFRRRRARDAGDAQ